MEKLREEGYEIEAAPHFGYKLIAIPDILIPSEIKWRLKAKIFGKEIISYKKVDSTNDTAYELAEKGAREGVVILAEEQARGRGRQGRRWISPPKGGIYMSCILRPHIAPNEIPRITLLAAVAITMAIRETTGLDALIKWPNDTMIEDRKICGILTEMKAEQDRVDFVVVGIGVNVTAPAKNLPKGASSLKDELRRRGVKTTVSRTELTKRILELLEEYYDMLGKKGFEPIIGAWKDLTAMLGGRVKVTLPNRNFEGQAHDINPDGALVVRLDSGLLENVSSGDVVMIR